MSEKKCMKEIVGNILIDITDILMGGRVLVKISGGRFLFRILLDSIMKKKQSRKMENNVIIYRSVQYNCHSAENWATVMNYIYLCVIH